MRCSLAKCWLVAKRRAMVKKRFQPADCWLADQLTVNVEQKR
jgi:hypothetical protein